MASLAVTLTLLLSMGTSTCWDLSGGLWRLDTAVKTLYNCYVPFCEWGGPLLAAHRAAMY